MAAQSIYSWLNGGKNGSAPPGVKRIQAGSGAEFRGSSALPITTELSIQGRMEPSGLILGGLSDPIDQDATMPLFLVAVHCLPPND